MGFRVVNNSKTIEEAMKSPAARDLLKCSAENNCSVRKKSPKDVKITQVLNDEEIYHETNLIKGVADNGKDIVVNKVFSK